MVERINGTDNYNIAVIYMDYACVIHAQYIESDTYQLSIEEEKLNGLVLKIKENDFHFEIENEVIEPLRVFRNKLARAILIGARLLYNHLKENNY